MESQTCGTVLKAFLTGGNKYTDFALLTYQTSQSITYVICSRLETDRLGEAIRAHFEQKEIQIPFGGEPCYSPELKKLCEKINKTTDTIITKKE